MSAVSSVTLKASGQVEKGIFGLFEAKLVPYTGQELSYLMVNWKGVQLSPHRKLGVITGQSVKFSLLSNALIGIEVNGSSLGAVWYPNNHHELYLEQPH